MMIHRSNAHGRRAAAGAHGLQANGGHGSGDRLLVMDPFTQGLLEEFHAKSWGNHGELMDHDGSFKAISVKIRFCS